MLESRRQLIKDIFLRLTDLDCPSRERALDEECGDDAELRSAVESLLINSREAPDDFLEPPRAVREAAQTARTTGALMADDGPRQLVGVPTAVAGDVIGPYRLVEKLGEGGFGVVWEAEQAEPIRRRVALKLVKLGMDTEQVLTRFDAERQALALMDHPNISTVLDAGSTGTGRPYFVMELVKGTPVLEYFESGELGVAARLDVLRKVCLAIHHAHQRGIIHRDIKPSNVLVVEQDGEPAPKVIDFGIAKATGSEISRSTPLTQRRQLMGTPAYMSPEQAEMGNRDIDTRSDIYSLGVLLYETLTGTAPFEPTVLAQAPLHEVVRIIREDEPARPSARVAERRGRNTLSLAGDLDWIVMKCLEKDRERRYESANELAEDLRRHLADEPVHAGPPDVGYRLLKFYRRNRVPMLAGAVLGACLVLFLGSGFAWTAWKNRQLDFSNQLLDERNVELVEEKAAVQEALDDIERLSDTRVLDELVARAEKLWPATPDKVKRMEAWLVEAEDLLGRIDRHREQRDVLRARGHHELYFPEEAREADEGSLATIRNRRDELKAELEEVDATPALMEQTVQDIEDFIAASDGVDRWTFDTKEDTWLHGLLNDLIQRLEKMSDPEDGLMASMRRRHEFASTLVARTIDDYELEWHETIEGVLTGPHYPALRESGFEPQVGLVPLGPDPKSGLYEFLHLATHRGPIPNRNERGNLRVSDTVGVILVLLPGATYEMGAQKEDPDGPNYDPAMSSAEGPVMKVSVEPFFLSKMEMSQGAWSNIENNRNPSYYYAGCVVNGRRVSLRHPVEQVSHMDCRKTLQKVGLIVPTEMQWEYGARGGTTTPWHTGRDPVALQGSANLADEGSKTSLSDFEPGFVDGHAIHAPFACFQPNAFGIYDVHGNVWEWCDDVFVINRKKSLDMKAAVKEDPSKARPKSAKRRSRRGAIHRVIRGGSFAERAGRVRISARPRRPQNITHSAVGVRPAREIR